jgi:hypothetical protein
MRKKGAAVGLCSSAAPPGSGQLHDSSGRAVTATPHALAGRARPNGSPQFRSDWRYLRYLCRPALQPGADGAEVGEAG